MKKFELISPVGTWENEFGSMMQITAFNSITGVFSGTYKSHTGATGVYNVTGMTDINPSYQTNSQTIAFAVSWRDISGAPPSPTDDTQHWVSGFSGQIQIVNGFLVMPTTYLLQKDTNPADNWGATIVATATFKYVSNTKT